jgi:hypothetical protein
MDRAAINDQIDRILGSRSFAGKSQLRKLLEVLWQNFDSQTTLKPDRVIRELWPQETRTKRSADVATEMNRLRHALETYYNGEGSNDPITVILPNRSVAGGDGAHEKRWIAAAPRSVEDRRPAATGPSRKSLMIVTAIAVVCVGALISLRLFAAHGQPKFARLDGAVLRVTDAEGTELWSKSFPDGFATDWYYDKATGTRIWFADLEGKGHTSVLFSYLAASGPQSHETTLICYSDGGTLKDSLSYSASTSTLTMNFTVGNNVVTTWNAWLVYQNTMTLLFSTSQPITIPPVVIPKTASVGTEGTVGVLTTLTTPTKGIFCFNYTQTKTGTP